MWRKFTDSHLVVGLGNDPGRSLLLDQEGVVEDIGDGYLARPGVDHLPHSNIINDPFVSLPHLCWHSGLNILILGVGDVRVEVEQGADLDWSSEPDILHAETERLGPAEHVGVGPGQLQSLPHDEPSEHLVIQISVLRLANLNILHPRILPEY